MKRTVSKSLLSCYLRNYFSYYEPNNLKFDNQVSERHCEFVPVSRLYLSLANLKLSQHALFGFGR